MAWSVSLYLAFPPEGSGLGLQQEVRFFSLNLLLSKIRTDWLNVAAADAREIYDVLLRQLPLNHHDIIVGARLCVVVAAAAALAGADTCYELVENVVGDSKLELALKIDLLTALAEETLHRGRNLSWMVKDCMEDCCPQVLMFLNAVVTSCGQSEISGKIFTCFERWIPAGVVLSELYTEYGSLFTSLLEAFKSPMEAVFQPAVWALSELVSQVDILPGREAAICALIKTILAQKWQYDAAATGQGVDQNGGISVHARGLCLLLSEVGSIEGALLCRSGIDGANVLEWLVDASRGGGGLGLEGALMAVEVWPRLATIPHARRGELLQPYIFGAAAQAILQAAKYPPSFEIWDDLSLEEEYFNRFRASIAEGALIAVFKELNGSFLSLILEILHGAACWQDAEVCLFATASISKEVIAATKHQNQGVTSFLKAVYAWLLGSPYETGSLYRQNEKLMEMSVLLLESYAEWTASEGSLVHHSLQYVIKTFSISAVRVKAACALKELCYRAASSLVTTWPVDTLIGSCESALSVPTQLHKKQEMQVQVTVVQGLASVIAVLPPGDAERALIRLTFGAISTIKEIAMGEGNKDQMAFVLESALNVVSGAVEYGLGDDGQIHPALHLLHDIWPALESLTITWAADGVVAAALCNLWGTVASKMGVSFVEVLPGIIVAASSLFKLHRVAAPLSCLSKVVALASLKPNPDLEKHLEAVLLDITSMLGGLDKVMDEIEQRSHVGDSTSTLPKLQENLSDMDFGSNLCMMYELGRSFLQYFPALLLSSGAFVQIFSLATGSVNRKDPDVALVAAHFLSDCILGPNDSSIKREQRNRNLPPDLMSHLDQVVGYYGMPIVEAVLRRLALSGVVEALKEALADVLYGLCVSYPAVTEAAIVSTLNAPDFPGKLGFKLDSDKKQFLDTVLRQPPHPRIRFQDFMRVFSGVCQMLLSAEALQQF